MGTPLLEILRDKMFSLEKNKENQFKNALHAICINWMDQSYNYIKDLKGELQDIRGDIDIYCSDWYGMAKTTARKANIEPSTPRVVGWQQHRSNVEAGTPKDYYKRVFTIPLLDHLISEIDTYFDPNKDAVMSSLLCLLPALLGS